MKECLNRHIESLKYDIEYYNEVIESAHNDKINHPNSSIASDNYYDRKIRYAEDHLFRSLAELERLKSRLNDISLVRTLR